VLVGDAVGDDDIPRLALRQRLVFGLVSVEGPGAVGSEVESQRSLGEDRVGKHCALICVGRGEEA
jgi:hypothetical protein